MPTPTVSQLQNIESDLANDLNVFAAMHSATITATANLATAQAAEAPAVAKTKADAISAFNMVLQYVASALTTIGENPATVLTPLFQAVIPPTP
jgi:hypothetical protein